MPPSTLLSDVLDSLHFFRGSFFYNSEENSITTTNPLMNKTRLNEEFLWFYLQYFPLYLKKNRLWFKAKYFYNENIYLNSIIDYVLSIYGSGWLFMLNEYDVESLRLYARCFYFLSFTTFHMFQSIFFTYFYNFKIGCKCRSL